MSSKHAPKPVPCVVMPGMRVKIGIGDGNDDREGTVVAALPECCVVRLDKKLEYGGGLHAAADWHLVTMLNLAPPVSGQKGGSHAK